MKYILRYLFILFFLNLSLFGVEIQVDSGLKKDARLISSLSSKYIYNFEHEQLQLILQPYLEIKQEIKALQIIENVDNEVFLTYYLDKNSQAVFNGVIPESYKSLKSVVQDIIYDDEVIGKALIYYKKSSKLNGIDLSEQERKWLEEHPLINVGGEMDWAPFDYVDDNGKYTGLSKEYLDLIAKKGGFKLKYHTGKTWDQLLDDIKKGSIDMLPAAYFSKQREEFINFTNSYLNLPEYFFTLGSHPDINSIKDLYGKTIALVKGYEIVTWINENHPQIDIIEKKNILECLRSVKSGESVAFIGDNPSTAYNLEKGFITGIRLNSVISSRDPIKLYMGVKKGYEPFVEILNKIIESLSKEEISNLSSKWMKKIEKKVISLSKEEKLWIDENPINRIGIMSYWPSDNNGDSLHTEVLKLINRYSGLNLVPIKFNTWNQGYKLAAEGKELHGIMGLSWSKEREDIFFYSPAYDFTPAYLITKKTNDDIKSFKDIANKTIYLKTNSITHKMMKQKSKSTKIIDIDSVEQMYEKLALSDEADAMLAYFIDEEALEEYGLKIIDNIYDRYGEVAIGINNKYHHLHNIINKVFKTIPKNELSSIRDRDWGDRKSRNLYALTKKEKKYLKEKSVINVCINPRWEPIEFFEGDEVKGISIDLLNIMKEKLPNIEYNFIKTDSWTQSQEFLRDKRCDILPSAVKTSKRSKYAYFTQPYLSYDLAIITTSDKPLVSSLESITSKTMSRKEGSALITKLKERYPYIKINISKGYKESLEDVVNKKVYFTICTIPVFSYYKSKYGIKNLQVAGYSDMKYRISMAVRNDDQVLLKIFNKTLKTIPNSTFNVVHEKWSQAKVIRQTNWDFLFKIVAGISLVVLFLIYNNRKLNAKVLAKTADIMKQKAQLEDLSKNLERKVEARTKELEIQKKQIEIILENILLPVLITSKKERIILYANRYAEIQYETKIEELVGSSIDKVYTVKNQKDDILRHMAEYGYVENLEQHYKTFKGKDFTGLLSVKPIIFEGQEAFIGMVTDITHQKEIEKEIRDIHKHTKDSIEYASLIQHSIVPDNEKFRKYFNDYFVIWHPKDIVGGDIYLFEELKDKDECLLMVIDCTGHGVPGAFVTMLVKAIERQVVAEINHSKDEDVSPAKILKIFNQNMKLLLKQEDENSISNAGFDGGVFYYNKTQMIVKYSGAETPLFYIENDELKTIRGSRHSVGYRTSDANFEFKEHTIEVKEGMSFYLATDGYFDQNGGVKGFPMGKKRFSKIIAESYIESCADQQEIFLEELHHYQGDEERNDDITLVGIKI